MISRLFLMDKVVFSVQILIEIFRFFYNEAIIILAVAVRMQRNMDGDIIYRFIFYWHLTFNKRLSFSFSLNHYSRSIWCEHNEDISTFGECATIKRITIEKKYRLLFVYSHYNFQWFCNIKMSVLPEHEGRSADLIFLSAHYYFC